MSFQVWDERVAENLSAFIDASNTTVAQPLSPQDGLARRIDALTATNSDGIAHTLELGVVVGPATYVIGQVLIPAGAGTVAIPPVDVLAGLPVPYQTGIIIAPGLVLTVRVTVTVTGAFDVRLIAMGGQT